MAAENPFRVGAHVTGEHFTDRADEVRRIVRAMREPTRLLVFGPRRMGKSSAMEVAAERARRDGALVVRADLATASGLVDVANRLLASLSRQRKRARLADFAASMAPAVTLLFDEVTGAPRVVLGLDRRDASAERQRKSLERVIEGLAAERASSERPVAVVLDEFQAVRRFGGEPAEWHLRDVLQRHGDLSFVCAGSEVSLVQEMTGPERAFFRMFELLHLGPVDPGHLARWIDERLGNAGVPAPGTGAAIIQAAGPRTQDVMQVARHVWARAAGRGGIEEGEVEGAVEDIVREEDPIVRSLWSGLTAHQQNVLRAVASDPDQLFSSAVRERFGLPSTSSMSAAVDALEGRGLLFRDPDSGAVAFDSPFVRRWVAEEALRDAPPAPE